MIRVAEGQRQRIAEHCGGFLKGYAMLGEIGFRLGLVPFEFQHVVISRVLGYDVVDSIATLWRPGKSAVAVRHPVPRRPRSLRAWPV